MEPCFFTTSLLQMVEILRTQRQNYSPQLLYFNVKMLHSVAQRGYTTHTPSSLGGNHQAQNTSRRAWLFELQQQKAAATEKLCATNVKTSCFLRKFSADKIVSGKALAAGLCYWG